MKEQSYSTATGTSVAGAPEALNRTPRLCARCEALPTPLPRQGMLYIAPPLAHTRGHMERLIQQVGAPYHERFPQVLAISLGDGHLQALAAILGAELSANELRDARSLLLPHDAMPSVPDLLQAEPLEKLLARVQSDWLLDVLREERLLTHFQPIVAAANPETVFAYECLIRGIDRDASLIPPYRIFSLAAKTDLLFQVDRAARLQNIRAAHAQGLRSHIFINFTPSAIYDPTYCLRSTVEAVTRAGIAPDQVVFEIVEGDAVRDEQHLVMILNTYRRAGFKVALDDVGSGYSSLNLLAQLNPDFIKLDMGLIRGVHANPLKATIALKLLEAARDMGIATVAEGVEVPEEYHWAREHGATYLQGYLFGKPAAAPAQPSDGYLRLGA